MGRYNFMKKIINEIQSMIYFQKSMPIRIIFLLSLLVTIFFFLLSFKNPLSQYGHNDEIEICISPNINDINFDLRIVGDTHKEVSKNIYTYEL